MPTLADFTSTDFERAVQSSLESLEGTSPYGGGPWVFDFKPFAEPPVAIYMASDGNYYQRPVSFEVEGEMLNAVLGERVEVESRTLWVPIDDAAEEAAFSFSGGSFEAKKTWKGLIFRAGEYKDKQVTVTTEDITRIVENFPSEGVPLMSEHEDSLIGRAVESDGGRLVRVWSEAGGAELHGEIETPGWLDYGLRNVKKSVSVGLSACKTKLREISLVNFPRVADAAVFRREAALAFTQTPTFTRFAADNPDAGRQLQELAKASNPNPAPAPARAIGDKTPMTFREKAVKGLSMLTPEQRAEIGLTDTEINDSANFAQEKPQANPLALPFARTKAGEHYDRLLRDRKIIPAQKDGFISTFTALLQAEGEGSINFSDSGEIVEGAKAKAFLETFEKGPAKFNIGERIPGDPEPTFGDNDPATKSFVEAAKATAAGKGGNK